jgi:hypothetical protein
MEALLDLAVMTRTPNGEQFPCREREDSIKCSRFVLYERAS